MKRCLTKIPDHVTHFVRVLPPEIKSKLRVGLDVVLLDPSAGKPLMNELEGLWSFRVLGYRIVYEFDRSELTVITIGPRASVYRDVLVIAKRGQRGV